MFPEELRLIQGASEKRRQEFATGRYCARLALANLGVAPAAILSDQNGAPVWPGDVVGSISHTRGLTAAWVAHADVTKGIGVDAEYRRGPFSSEVFDAITTAAEKRKFRNYPQAVADTLCYALFSAKESVFKCFYSACHESLTLETIDICIDARLSSFSTARLGDGTGLPIQGRIGFCSDYVITVAWWPNWV